MGTWPVQVAGPSGWGLGCRTAPHRPPPAEHSPPRSAALPRRLAVTGALRQPPPCLRHSAQGPAPGRVRAALPGPRPAPPQPRAPRDPAPGARLRGLDVRAAGPGGAPRRSLPAAGLALRARTPRARGAPLRSPRAGPARRAAVPGPPLRPAAAAARAQPLAPLSPARAPPPAPLLPEREREPPDYRGGSFGVPDRGRRHLSGALCPGGSGRWDGALCPAVLQRAQGGARVSPPGAAAPAPSAERLRSPLSLLRPLCQLPGRTLSMRPPRLSAGAAGGPGQPAAAPAPAGGAGGPRAGRPGLRSRSLAL